MSAITVQLGVVRACKACAAMIMYYPTSWPLAPGTKLMPIDAEPVADGNVVLDAAGEVSIARVLKTGESVEPGRLRYVSHFATCARAKDFRKPRGRRGA